MRKTLLVAVVILSVSVIGIQVTLADGMILPELADSGYLAVRYHHVTVNIADNHAVTSVTQEFYNPQPFPVNGRYLFPVPPDAMMTGFQATVDNVAQTVTRQDVATTNAALYGSVLQNRDPSLLQYADWESMAFDLSLPAGGSRIMTLQYEQVLAPSGGLYNYRYILSTERYSSLPVESVSISINLQLSSNLATLHSPSHDVAIERYGDGEARISWSMQYANPSEDFELFFAPAEGGFGGGLLTGQRAGENHLLFMFTPEDEISQNNALPKDIVFVIDRSGSMSGEKIVQSRNALLFILGQLNENDRFSVVGFDDQLDVFSYTLQPVNSNTVATARSFVGGIYDRGGTDIEWGLRTGLDILQNSEARQDATQIIVFLTDGLPTSGITDEGLIASSVSGVNERSDARFHVFGVGYDVNTHLLDRLAVDNSGSVTYVQPGENLEIVLSDFYGKIATPVLTDIEIEFEGIEVSDLHPQQPPDMFKGSSLLLTGLYDGDGSDITITVRGRAGAEEREYVYHFDLGTTSGNDFVPRLWATRQIGLLLDIVRVEGESAALVEEIRALGLKYGLVTPYTTFIISAQTEGAASASNMELYGNTAELNQVSGQTTVQARTQNQMYQQATQTNMAVGANIINQGQNSVAQVAEQNIDLALLQGQSNINEPVTTEWIEQNIQVDRQVVFGSEEYFELANNPEIRDFLQSGIIVIFIYDGEVILVQDSQ